MRVVKDFLHVPSMASIIYNQQVVIDYYNEVGITLVPEYKFSEEHGYRFDFLHEPSKVAIEVQGGIWLARGGHTTGKGYTRDMEKNNLALSLGYRVFKCTPAEVCMDDTRRLFAKIVEVANGRTRVARSTDTQRSSVSVRRNPTNANEESKTNSTRRRSRV